MHRNQMAEIYKCLKLFFCDEKYLGLRERVSLSTVGNRIIFASVCANLLEGV